MVLLVLLQIMVIFPGVHPCHFILRLAFPTIQSVLFKHHQFVEASKAVKAVQFISPYWSYRGQSCHASKKEG